LKDNEVETDTDEDLFTQPATPLTLLNSAWRMGIFCVKRWQTRLVYNRVTRLALVDSSFVRLTHVKMPVSRRGRRSPTATSSWHLTRPSG